MYDILFWNQSIFCEEEKIFTPVKPIFQNCRAIFTRVKPPLQI